MKRAIILESADRLLIDGILHRILDTTQCDSDGTTRNHSGQPVDQVLVINPKGTAVNLKAETLNRALFGQATSKEIILLCPGDIGHLDGAPIRAEVHDDNHRFEVKFDARLWFEKASDEDIIYLYEENWTAGYASDPVAEFFENINRQITNFFESKGDSGFSVSVNEDDAIAWIKQHRPHLAEKMSA
jgi:hypothetical protein